MADESDKEDKGPGAVVALVYLVGSALGLSAIGNAVQRKSSAGASRWVRVRQRDVGRQVKRVRAKRK